MKTVLSLPSTSILRNVAGVSLALTLAGCGGSALKSSNDSRAGSLKIRAAWPTSASRVIPSASQSIKVQVIQNSVVTNQVLLSPSSPTATLTQVPTGSVTVKAVAYPAADGTGTALASGTTTQSVTAGLTASVDLTMASTIDHLTMTPNPIRLALLGIVTQQTTVTAYDTLGAVVLMNQSDLTYSTGGSGVFLYNGTGLLTGLALGSSTFIATDTVSGKSASASVIVTLN